MKCKIVICNILAAKMYAIVSGFNIKKLHGEKYQIMKKKLYHNNTTEYIKETKKKSVNLKQANNSI